MASPSTLVKEERDWHKNLQRQTNKDWKFNKKDVINPDQKALEAYMDLYTYLEDRGRLIEKKKGIAGKKGRKESFEDHLKGGYRDNMDRLNTLLEEAIQGRWKYYEDDPTTEQELFNQNQKYKYSLPWTF